MECKLKRRLDDIPKRSARERSWVCEACGAIMFSRVKPVCRKAALAEVQARHASALAEAHFLHLDEKVKPE